MIQDSKATTLTTTWTGGCYSGDVDDKFLYCCKDKNLVILKCWTKLADCEKLCWIKP
nr:hypothetical protein [Tanacetum cinerariifolium]